MMKKIILTIVILFISFIAVKVTFSDEIKVAGVDEFNDYFTVSFPKGTYFRVILEKPIDSSVNSVDDDVYTFIPFDLYLGNVLVIPKNSKFVGKISYIEPAHIGRDTIVTVKFYAVLPANNEFSTIPIQASIVDKNSNGSIGGNITDRKKWRKVVHTVEHIGSIVQVFPTGEHVMGKEIYIPAGENWVIKLDEAVQYNLKKG